MSARKKEVTSMSKVKPIRFEYEGTQYTLEFNRNTVRTMENQGFRVDELGSRPMTMLPQLFQGAFLMHHRFLKKDVIDEIYAHMGDKDKLLEKLGELYNAPMEALFSDPEDGKGNAIAWTAE